MNQSQYIFMSENIRYKAKFAPDYTEGAIYERHTVKVYSFEVFKRPYFFGLLGRKKWCSIGDWATVHFGKQYALKVLGSSHYKKIKN